MRLSYTLLVATVTLLGFGCSSGEEPAASAASEGAEVTAPPAPAATSEAPPAPATEQQAQPEAQTPAAQVESPQAPEMPPYAAIVIHQVKDYDAWKTAFDGDLEARKAAGIAGEGLMRGVDDDKTVAVYFPTADAEQWKAFSSSKELKDKMKEAGVKGKPTIYLFKSVSGKIAQQPSGDVYGAIVKYGVKDFDAFKTAIEGADESRAQGGIIGWGLGQGVDKPTDAFLYLQSDDAGKLKAYLDAKETKAAMKEAGAKGQPKVTLVKEESNTMY